MKTVIGVSALYHDSAAAAVTGNQIIAAVQEERFSRKKHDPRFPQAALDYCLQMIGGAAAIDAIAFYEDPALCFGRVVENAVELAPATERLWPEAAAAQLGQKLDVLTRLAEVAGPRAADDIFIVDHHMSHLASAFYPSPFETAALVVADGVGEWATTTIADGTGTHIEPLAQIHYPHSLGLFYSAFTFHCGLKVNSGEYKLMGLAPYGQPRFVQTILDNLIDLRADGSFALNTDYFGFMTSQSATSPRFAELFGLPCLAPDAKLTIAYMDLAASAQAVVDQAMLGIARRAMVTTGRRHLCLAGGVALNCVTNGKLLRGLPDLHGIWIQPASGDAGGALGAALHVAHRHFGAPRHADLGQGDGQHASLLGPAFTPEHIERALTAAGVVWHKPAGPAAHADCVARALANGLIVGRFEGRMEFGPRALGNRSILADARRADGQSHINRRIKFRESWRPFAPVVLRERSADYFDLAQDSPYMLLVADLCQQHRIAVDWSDFRAGEGDMIKIVNQRRSSLPGITHIDYSARVQTVDAARNPDFHALLHRFAAITGCPVLINTSFNVRGEPIVCTPEDAIRCFLNTGIELLAIGPYVAFKSEQPAELTAQEGSMQFDRD